MGFLDHFRRKGEIEIEIAIRNLPEHLWSSAYLCLTKVPLADSPFPADDPGAPLHKCDAQVVITEGPGQLTQPLIARTQQPSGFYFVLLRVMLGRKIKDTFGLQIENFNLSGGAAAARHGTPVRYKGSVTWPTVADDELHAYGPINELLGGGG
jgi:hypothetical protein